MRKLGGWGVDLSRAAWRKSSRSNSGGNCVEVAANVPGVALVRDSKLGDSSPIIATSPTAFATFLDGVKLGRFDRG